jgi:predicted transcriptional regulator
VGREAAERLCGHFTVGIKIGIPLLPKAIAVHVLTAQRMSAREIAHKLGITERTVVRARNETTLPAASGLTLDPFGATSRFIFEQLGLTNEDVQHYGA